jgi:hypothetical protein
MAWEEVGSAPPQDIWVHRIHLEHDTAPEHDICYESGSMAYCTFYLVTKHVDVTCDVVFDKKAQWD